MSISAISSSSATYQPSLTNSMKQMKQNFDDIGKALQSGNLDDAKKAYAELQKNMPSKGSNNKTPAEMESLGKALDSGDISAAKDAYSKVQQKMSQGPPAGGKPSGGPPKGAPPKGAKGGGQGKGASSGSSSSNKTYDKMDANKDGTVSEMERLEYTLKHPKDTSDDSKSSSSVNASSSSANNTGCTGVDTYA